MAENLNSIHLQKLVNTNLDFVLTELIPLIENDYAQVASSEVIERLKATVIALTDDVAGNKEQINLIWGTVTSDPEIVEVIRGSLLEAISKIDEPMIVEGLKLLINPITATLTAVSDQTKPDGAQIKAIWKDFVESPEFLTFILSNLGWIVGRLVKNENAKEWILKIINAFIK
mgnify:CR=1 FL=1